MLFLLFYSLYVVFFFSNFSSVWLLLASTNPNRCLHTSACILLPRCLLQLHSSPVCNHFLATAAHTHSNTDSNTGISTYSKVELGPKVIQHFMQVGTMLFARQVSLPLLFSVCLVLFLESHTNKHFFDTAWADYLSSCPSPFLLPLFHTSLFFSVPSTPLDSPFNLYFNADQGVVKLCKGNSD